MADYLEVLEDAEEAMDLDLGAGDVWDLADWIQGFSESEIDLSGGGLVFMELTPIEKWLEGHGLGAWRYVNYFQHTP